MPPNLAVLSYERAEYDDVDGSRMQTREIYHYCALLRIGRPRLAFFNCFQNLFLTQCWVTGTGRATTILLAIGGSLIGMHGSLADQIGIGFLRLAVMSCQEGTGRKREEIIAP